MGACGTTAPAIALHGQVTITLRATHPAQDNRVEERPCVPHKAIDHTGKIKRQLHHALAFKHRVLDVGQ
jgi:hypothetical protein